MYERSVILVLLAFDGEGEVVFVPELDVLGEWLEVVVVIVVDDDVHF